MKNNNNHIALSQNITVTQNIIHNPHPYIIQAIALYLCIRGCMLSLYLTLGTSNSILISLLMIVFPVLFTMIFNMKKFSFTAIIGCIGLYIGGIILYFYEIKQALVIINANFLESINYYFKTGYSYYSPSFTNEDYSQYTSVLTIAIIFFLSLLMGLFIVRLKNSILTALVLIPFIYLSVMITDKPHSFTLFLIFCGFCMVLPMQSVFFKPRGKKINDYFSMNQKDKTRKYALHNKALKSQNITSSSVLVVVFTLILVVVIQFVVPREGYDPNNETRRSLENMIEKFNEFDISKFSFDNFSISNVGGGVGNGKLGDVEGIIFDKELHLKIRTEDKTPMYLKGYIGSKYENNKWNNLKEHDYRDYDELFEDFEKAKMSPQNIGEDFREFTFQHPEVFNIISNYPLNPSIRSTISIENVAANHAYIYTPYHFTNSAYRDELPNGNFVNDTYIESKVFSKKSYIISSYLFLNFGDNNFPYYTPFQSTVSKSINAVKNQYMEQNAAKQSATLEARYETLAKDLYTRLPEGELAQLKQVATSLNGENSSDVESIILKVREYLSSHTTYSLHPGKTPKDKDFAEYFLFNSQKGYCAHYATAATLMLRANGIPARYVEGYTITQKDYDKMEGNTVDILDTNAHAWVEVYISKLGWVPYEMTPGFSLAGLNEQNENEPLTSSQPEESEPVSSQVSSEMSSTPSSSIPSETVSSQTSSTLDKSDAEALRTNKNLWIMAIALILLFAFLLIILARRMWILHQRRNSFKQSSINQSAIAVYIYIKQQLAFIGFHLADHSNEQAFALFVEENSNLFERGTLQEVTQLVCKARFSQYQITQEELVTLKAFATIQSGKIYETLSFTKKIWYRYAKVLI